MVIQKKNNKDSFIFLNFLACIIPILSILGNIGKLSSNFANMNIALAILTGYFFWILKKNEIKIIEILMVLLTILPIVLNAAPNMISILLMLLLHFLFQENRNSESALKIYFYISIILYLVIVALYFTIGFNSQYNFEMWRIDKIIFRQTLGFRHANVAMLVYIGIFFASLGLINMKFFRLKILVLLIFSYFCFQYTQSRTSTYVIVCICIVLLILGENSFKIININLNRILKFVPVTLFLLSVTVLFMPRNELINQLFSGRQNLYQSYYNSIDGLQWLASPMLEDTMFDNGYLHALMAKGGLFALFLLAVYSWIINQYKKINYIQMVTYIGFCAIAFTETSLFRFEIFFPVILSLNLKKIE